jgi:pyruvate/2-oxoglutarate dehydrogenase complex dihydrolipoamide dehydrogenase (E3) component
MYGGTCINVGCIPSKSLVHSAAASAAHKKDDFDKKTSRYAAAVAERERVTSMLRKKNFDKLNDNANVTVINGTAAFVDAKRSASKRQAKNLRSPPIIFSSTQVQRPSFPKSTALKITSTYITATH